MRGRRSHGLALVLLLGCSCDPQLPARPRSDLSGPPLLSDGAPPPLSDATPPPLPDATPPPLPDTMPPPLSDAASPPPPDAAPLPQPDTAPPPPTGSVGTIVPLYAYPTHSSWNVIAQTKQANPSVPVVAIVNVSNGPGSAPEANFTSGINQLVNAGVQVIGYVFTSYGNRSVTAVKSEVASWKQWYPQVTGIFFDEQASVPGKESYYATLGSYAKSLGLSLTVGNPGTDTSPGYVGTVDVILIYETDGLPALAALGGWHQSYPKSNFGIIPYAVPSLDTGFITAAKPLVGHIYVTDDSLPNPWDSLPSYFGQLVTALGK
jgi:hypothetical protein